MNALPPVARAALWWGVPIVALAALVGYETDWGRALHTPVPTPAPVVPQPVAPALLPEFALEGGLAARGDTVARTLFNPTRRPAPLLAAGDASKPQMKRGQFALAGTIVVDGKSMAFLRELPAGKSRKVMQGETINGMLVSEVKPDRVRLTVGDESEEIPLKVVAGPKSTVQPVPAAPGTPGLPATPAAPMAQPAAAPAPAPPAPVDNSLRGRRAAARAAVEGNAGAGGAAGGSTGGGTGGRAAPGQADPGWATIYQQRYGIDPNGGAAPTK